MKKLLTFHFLIRVGLGCVFLSNSLVAFFTPAEFHDLIAQSFVAGLLPVSIDLFVHFISINDLVVALLLFSGWHTARVALWAVTWLVGVVAVIGVISLDALEHLGFIAMAVALVTHADARRK